jgi:hypothetical protein
MQLGQRHSPRRRPSLASINGEMQKECMLSPQSLQNNMCSQSPKDAQIRQQSAALKVVSAMKESMEAIQL